MAAKKAQDEQGQQPENAGQDAAQDAAQGAAQGATEGAANAEQNNTDGEGESTDGEPATSRGGAKKAGASSKASGNAQGPEGVTPATPGARAAQVYAAPAMSAPMHEKHLGVVNAKGEKVDLDKVIVKDVPTGTVMRATEVIYEETTWPGAEERTRRRILFGKDAPVTEAQFRDLKNRSTELAEAQ